MSINFGSISGILSSPQLMNLGMMAAASTPQGQAILMGLSLFSQLSGNKSQFKNQQIQGMNQMFPLINSLLLKLGPMFSHHHVTEKGGNGENHVRRRRRHHHHRAQNKHQTKTARDTTGREINSILNDSSLSIEEKIILIAGVASESISEQLEDKLKEQGKMAKKIGEKGSNSGSQDVASTQNVENKIQLLMQRLNRMQTLASNMIQAMHSSKKAQIMNIRV